MRERFIITIIFVVALVCTGMSNGLEARNQQDELLEYEVISLDPSNWVVTAKETESGEIVKFKMPPSVFMGKSFDANLDRTAKGQRFEVRGQKNARFDQLVVEKPQPGSESKGDAISRFSRGQEENLGWTIIDIEAQDWVVTAKSRQTNKVAKFRVHPEAFTGFRFKANIRGIKKGNGFSILTPNNTPINNIATLLELQK